MTQRDRRQDILDQLWADIQSLTVDLAGGDEGPVSILASSKVRNRNQLQADKVPGIVLLDADEVRDPRMMSPMPGTEQTRMRPQMMKMTPEIYVVLDVRGPQNPNVGKDLNTARLAVLNSIFTDPLLWKAVGTNGDITYDGMITDLARNRTMKGQLGISVTFTYPLLVTEQTA